MSQIIKRKRPFLIAEIGINHNGSLKFAKQLIDLAKKEKKTHLSNRLKHVLSSTPPSTDVGLGRLIGHPEGVIPKIDAWNESLNGEFQDKWNQELSEIEKKGHPLFVQKKKGEDAEHVFF